MESARSADRHEQIALVNKWVNARLAFVEDARQYGQADHWANAAQSLGRGKGDCEDYAIAKLQLLRALGFSGDDLYFVIVHDLVRRADHAVLVVRMSEGFSVLDSGTDQIFDAATARDYRPILSYNASHRWIHGYRAQPVLSAQLASTEAGL